jgi:hypothetical protein
MELRYCSQALTNPIEVLIAVRPLSLGGGAKSSPDTVYFTAGPNGET